MTQRSITVVSVLSPVRLLSVVIKCTGRVPLWADQSVSRVKHEGKRTSSTYIFEALLIYLTVSPFQNIFDFFQYLNLIFKNPDDGNK